VSIKHQEASASKEPHVLIVVFKRRDKEIRLIQRHPFLGMNVPHILYKYLPPYFGTNTADILPILDNHLIRYSQLSAMNDKREGTRGLLVLDIDKHLEATRIKSLQILGLNWIYDRDPDKYNKIIFIQRFGMQEEMKRKQYHNDPISFSNEIITEILKTLDEKNGFLSLSDNWKNETMWSHYTLTNTGVCIGFKTSSMLLRGYKGGFQGVRKLKKVSYSDNRVVIDLEKDKDYDLYFHKHSSGHMNKSGVRLVDLTC
jgi:hypothetical protein